MRKLIIVPILIVVSLVLTFLIYQKQKSNSLPPDVIYSSGSVEANTITISAQISGKITAKKFDRGAVIKSGDTLMLIEKDVLEAKIKELESSALSTNADLEAARIDVANVKRNLDRTREAFQAGSVPQKTVDDLSSSYQSGMKKIDALLGKLDLLKAQKNSLLVQLGYTTVISPVAGYIQAAPAEVGEIAMVGGTLFEIVDLSDTWVEIYVNEADIPSVHLNDQADVYLDANPNSAIKGIVSFISQKAEFTPKNVQTKKERVKQVFAVRVKVDNQSQQFKPGLPVDVYLKKK